MASSSVVSGILAIMVIGTLCAAAIYQVLKGQPVMVPPFLEGVAGVIIGYFFSHQAAATTASNIVNGLTAAHDAPVPGQVTTTTNPPRIPPGGPTV